MIKYYCEKYRIEFYLYWELMRILYLIKHDMNLDREYFYLYKYRKERIIFLSEPSFLRKLNLKFFVNIYYLLSIIYLNIVKYFFKKRIL